MCSGGSIVYSFAEQKGQIHFVVWELSYFDQNFTEITSQLSNFNKPALFQIMASPQHSFIFFYFYNIPLNSFIIPQFLYFPSLFFF